MSKKNSQVEIRKNVIPPMPVVLAGTVTRGKENFMTVGWCARVNANPPKIAVGIHRSHLTADAIAENREFSVVIPGSDLEQAVDYCGVVSGKKADKSHVFSTFRGTLDNAPLIEEGAVNLECRLTETLELESNTLFIGEIVGAWAREDVQEGGKLSVEKMNPMILTMPDNRYWSLDTVVGKAWKDGLEYKPE